MLTNYLIDMVRHRFIAVIFFQRYLYMTVPLLSYPSHSSPVDYRGISDYKEV